MVLLDNKNILHNRGSIYINFLLETTFLKREIPFIFIIHKIDSFIEIIYLFVTLNYQSKIKLPGKSHPQSIKPARGYLCLPHQTSPRHP